MVDQEAEAQQEAGRQNLERHRTYNPLPSGQIPLSWGRARVVLGGEMTFQIYIYLYLAGVRTRKEVPD